MNHLDHLCGCWRAVGFALLLVPAMALAVEPAREISFKTPDSRIQDLKQEVLDLNRDLFVLEEELLFPASTQVALFVSMDVGKLFELDSVQIKLDDKVVANYLYTPLEVQENLGANFGAFAQDSWNLGKLTLNYGVRYDYNHQYIVGQKAQQGRFANIAAYSDIDLPTWSNFSPRVSAVYNLSGDGKTAVRVGYNKFVTAQTTGFAQLYNPTALTSQTLPWTDVNGDDIAQGERGCVYLSAGCEINFATLPANFGVRSLARFDANLQRPYQLAFNAGLEGSVVVNEVRAAKAGFGLDVDSGEMVDLVKYA